LGHGGGIYAPLQQAVGFTKLHRLTSENESFKMLTKNLHLQGIKQTDIVGR